MTGRGSERRRDAAAAAAAAADRKREDKEMGCGRDEGVMGEG